MRSSVLRARMKEPSNKTAQTVALWARQWGLDVFRYCRGLLGSDSDAEDAAQMVFLQAIQDFAQFREPGLERPWLLSIARHRCLDRLKLLRRRPSMADEDEALEVPIDGRGPDDQVASSEASRSLARCLDELPAPSRVAVLLRYHDQLSYELIEGAMGTTVGALRVRVLRALVQLKECLERKGISW